MKTNRLEALSDGVIAIIITIMVLELKVPHEGTVEGLKSVLPKLLAYALSFVYVGIYWNNHHHLFHASDKLSGGVLWANLNLLFWLSLIPVTTDWVGESHSSPLPMAMYGAVLLLSGIAYTILVRVLVAVNGADSLVARAIGEDLKGWASLACYTAAIGLSFWHPWMGATLYVIVALMWLIPDRRIEKKVSDKQDNDDR